jgi:hypothetical protein
MSIERLAASRRQCRDAPLPLTADSSQLSTTSGVKGMLYIFYPQYLVMEKPLHTYLLTVIVIES